MVIEFNRISVNCFNVFHRTLKENTEAMAPYTLIKSFATPSQLNYSQEEWNPTQHGLPKTVQPEREKLFKVSEVFNEDRGAYTHQWSIHTINADRIA